MSYFDYAPERRGSNSYKWDTPAKPDVIPMWVADMDFRTAPCVIDALRRRVEHGVFGYTKVPDEYYKACAAWFARRHNWKFDTSHVIYTSGVVPAISAIIKALTVPGDKVITQTPAFNCFFSSIRNNGCQLASNELIREDDGSYSIDFDNLADLAADPHAKVLLLCNPHNPSGRVWTRDELERVGRICLDNDVFVISDEIHCELTFKRPYTPYASLGGEFARRCAVCISPSKAFNIAGLQIANIVAADNGIRARIDKAININEVCDVNPFGVAATIAAYNEGADWLDTLRDYLWANVRLASDFFGEFLPDYPVTPIEATYLMWIDIRHSGLTSDALAEKLEKDFKIKVSPGSMFGPGGEGFIRLNVACPRARLFEALPILASALK